MKKQPRKQFVINVDENSPEFREHILRRLEFSQKHPEKSISVDELKERLQTARKQFANA